MGIRKRIKLDPHFKEFIALLNSEGVRYLLLGGYAVNYYGHQRFTGDIDFWISTDIANAERVSAALQRFAFPAESVPPEQFTVPNKVHIFGVIPARVDLLTGPSGVDFEECYARRVVSQIDGIELSIISLEDLWKNKEASGRDKDLSDLKHLPKPNQT